MLLMRCWNNININKFQPKDNNDALQCVKCNKCSFAPRLKSIKRKKEKKMLNTKNNFQMFLKQKTLF
jgi:hypothetical protein